MFIEVTQGIVDGIDRRARGNGCASDLIELPLILLQGPSGVSRLVARFSAKGLKPAIWPVADMPTQRRRFVLLKGFDTEQSTVGVDGNQQLDESEWNRVRLAAQLEAEDRHRMQSLQPAQHQMGKPSQAQPFILSSHGEDQLARQFYWQALAGGVVCLLGALALTWLLRNALP